MAFYSFYFALYAQIAIGITFMPLWLRSKGLTEPDIGTYLALAWVIAVIVNPLVGSTADRTRRHKVILIGLIVGATLTALTFPTVGGTLIVGALFLVYRSFTASLVPLSESILLANLTRYGLDFGRVRAWGSASVVMTTLLCGFLVDWTGPTAIIYLLLVILVTQIVLSTGLPSTAREGQPPVTTAAIVSALRNRSLLLLVGSAAVSQACHGVFYAYSTFRWLEAGHSTSAIGIFWGLGVGAEIIAFALGSRLTSRFSPGKIIAIGCLAGILRWGLFGLSAETIPTLVIQVLQGVTLGMTQVGLAAYMRRNIAPEFLSSASGVYAASTGLITALAIFASARLYPIDSGYVFLLTAGLCALAMLVALTMVRYEKV